MNWLKRLYSGEEISDKELFLKDIPVKGKNGYHSIDKDKNKMKISTKTDKNVSDKKIVPECDDQDLISDRALADLVYLAKRDLDDFTAPTFDEEDLSLHNGHDLVKNDVLNPVKVEQSKTPETKSSARYKSL